MSLFFATAAGASRWPNLRVPASRNRRRPSRSSRSHRVAGLSLPSTCSAHMLGRTLHSRARPAGITACITASDDSPPHRASQPPRSFVTQAPTSIAPARPLPGMRLRSRARGRARQAGAAARRVGSGLLLLLLRFEAAHCASAHLQSTALPAFALPFLPSASRLARLARATDPLQAV